MNSTTTSRRRSIRRPVNLAPDLVWHHLGRAYRITIWPEVAFEKEVAPGLWRTFTPDPRGDVFCAGAVMLDKRRWNTYLEFFPQSWQNLIGQFSFHRLHALTALALCPALHEEFESCPILALLAASHADLRGSVPEWGEINAVGEMGSVYALLEWLGLPSTKETIDQLEQIDLDIPLRDLRQVREVLWQRHDAKLRGKVRRISFSPLAA